MRCCLDEPERGFLSMAAVSAGLERSSLSLISPSIAMSSPLDGSESALANCSCNANTRFSAAVARLAASRAAFTSFSRPSFRLCDRSADVRWRSLRPQSAPSDIAPTEAHQEPAAGARRDRCNAECQQPRSTMSDDTRHLRSHHTSERITPRMAEYEEMDEITPLRQKA